MTAGKVPPAWVLAGCAATALGVAQPPCPPPDVGVTGGATVRALAVMSTCCPGDPASDTWPDTDSQALPARTSTNRGRELLRAGRDPAPDGKSRARSAVLVAPKTGPPA